MSRAARIRAQSGWETGQLLRNGEQLTLTLVIPVVLLLGLSLTGLLPSAYADARLERSLAAVLAVSVMATAFTSLAIATGFERRSGALRYLATTPLRRGELLAGKALATLAMTALSAGAVAVTGLVLGWRPVAGSAWALPVLVLGTASLAACGFALAGVLRAEAVLAVANGAFLVLILFGGVVVPAASLPGPLAALAPWLPSGALADALQRALVLGAAPTAGSVAVLAAWAALGSAVAARTFRWS